MSKKPSKCLTKRCRGIATKSGRSPYCSKCRSRRWADSHWLHYAFKNLKQRARQRGKAFTLTLDQFVNFAKQTGLEHCHGRGKFCLTVNRKDNTKGYTQENIEAITKSDNSIRQKFVPYFKNKAEEAAAIAESEERARICNRIAEELGRTYDLESDEFRAAYIQKTNEVFANQATT